MPPYRHPVFAPTGGIPSFEEQEEDPRALWNSLHVGDPLGMASPSEDMAMKRLLGEHAVERTRRERAAADADGQTSIATQIERGRADAAADPRYGGYAAQWTPFFEALRGSKVKVGALDLPSRDGTGRVEMPRVDMPRVEMPRVTMPSIETPQVAMDSLARGREARNPSDEELEALRAGSSLGTTPSIWGGKPKIETKAAVNQSSRYDRMPDFYASLASLQRGR